MSKSIGIRIDNLLTKAQAAWRVDRTPESHAKLNMVMQLLAHLLTIQPIEPHSVFVRYLPDFLEWFFLNDLSLGSDYIPVLEQLSGSFYFANKSKNGPTLLPREQTTAIVIKTLTLVCELDTDVAKNGLKCLTNIFFTFDRADFEALLPTEFVSLVKRCAHKIPHSLSTCLISFLHNVFSDPGPLRMELLYDERIQGLLFQSLFVPDFELRFKAYDWLFVLVQESDSQELHRFLSGNAAMITGILHGVHHKTNKEFMKVKCKIVGALLRGGNTAVQRDWASENAFLEAVYKDRVAMNALETLATTGLRDVEEVFQTWVAKELPNEWLDNWA